MSILKGKQLGIVELTGSLFGTSSYAVTASYAMNGGSGASSTFPYSGSAVITGSLLISGSETITGSLNVTQGITGSLFGTSSWSTNAITASYTLNGGTGGSTDTGSLLMTASFINPNLEFEKGDKSGFSLNLSSLVVTNAQTASFINGGTF